MLVLTQKDDLQYIASGDKIVPQNLGFYKPHTLYVTKDITLVVSGNNIYHLKFTETEKELIVDKNQLIHKINNETFDIYKSEIGCIIGDGGTYYLFDGDKMTKLNYKPPFSSACPIPTQYQLSSMDILVTRCKKLVAKLKTGEYLIMSIDLFVVVKDVPTYLIK